jgi:hypothetical protein
MVALTWTSSAWIGGCCAHQHIGYGSRVKSPIDIDLEKQTHITKRMELKCQFRGECISPPEAAICKSRLLRANDKSLRTKKTAYKKPATKCKEKYRGHWPN